MAVAVVGVVVWHGDQGIAGAGSVVAITDQVVAISDRGRSGSVAARDAVTPEGRVVDVDAGVDDTDLDASAGQAERVLCDVGTRLRQRGREVGADRFALLRCRRLDQLHRVHRFHSGHAGQRGTIGRIHLDREAIEKRVVRQPFLE